ncbi:MAG: membrane protein insertion efficiency factor YidD [Candidatus Eisenbacteria bacterium]
MTSREESPRRPLALTGALVLLVRAYQRLVSPLMPATCRFVPSCSEYAAQALLTHGLVRGICYAVARVVRCHPWAEGGEDPVPH